MKSASPGDDFYRAPITLIVEDPTTQVFLEEIWERDPKINIRVGAGHEGVAALVKGAPDRHELLVVGMVDRDLGTRNSDRWDDPSTKIFRLDRHEIENYFLDWKTLASLSEKKLSAEQIEQEALAFAALLVWWMACKIVLRKIRTDWMDGFPEEPRLPPTPDARDKQSAVAYLQNHPVWKNHAKALKSWEGVSIERKITEEGQRYQHDLESAMWLETFSGKEIFRHLRDFAALDRTLKFSSPAQRDEDLGRKIGSKMLKAGVIPPELTRLRGVLRKRAGL